MPSRLPKNVFADSPLRSTVAGVPLAEAEVEQPTPEATPRPRRASKPAPSASDESSDVDVPSDAEKVSVYVSKEIRDLVEDEVYRRRKAGSRINRQVVYREALEAWAKTQRRKS